MRILLFIVLLFCCCGHDAHIEIIGIITDIEMPQTYGSDEDRVILYINDRKVLYRLGWNENVAVGDLLTHNGYNYFVKRNKQGD